MSTQKNANTLNTAPDFYFPETLTEVLQAKRRWPEAQIWAGGTHIINDPVRRAASVIAIHGVRELRRVVRGDVHVEVGASVPIGRLRDLGNRFLPPILTETLKVIGPPPLQNVATLGGALCIEGCVLPVNLVLRLLEARLELRRQGNSRSIPLSRFSPGSGEFMRENELLTRIRIPDRGWTHWLSQCFGPPYPAGSDSLAIAALVSVERQAISDMRIGAVCRSSILFRNRELEAEFVGKTLPLSPRDIHLLEQTLTDDESIRSLFSPISRHRTVHGIAAFFDRIRLHHVIQR